MPTEGLVIAATGMSLGESFAREDAAGVGVELPKDVGSMAEALPLQLATDKLCPDTVPAFKERISMHCW